MEKRKVILLSVLVFSVLLLTTITAIWIVSISSSATYNIFSTEYGGLTVTQDFAGGSSDSLINETYLKDEFIFNYSGEKRTEVLLDISTDKVDVIDECTTWENDCDIIYTFRNKTEKININEGTTNLDIDPGEHIIDFILSCEQYSCPQDITPIVTITKVSN